MSVLAENRSLSKAEFVKEGREITVRTVNLLSRLSARYARVLSDDVKKCVIESFVYCVKANSVYPTSFSRCNLREEYLLRAKAGYDALDGVLAIIYEILRTNPEGAFTDVTGKKSLDIKRANEKLDKMVDILGASIDREQALLTGQLDFITKNRRKIFNNTVGNYMKAGRTREDAVKLAQLDRGVELKTVESKNSSLEDSIELAKALKEYDAQNEAAMAEEIMPDLSKVEVEKKDDDTAARPVEKSKDSKEVQAVSPAPAFVITEDMGRLDSIFKS